MGRIKEHGNTIGNTARYQCVPSGACRGPVYSAALGDSHRVALKRDCGSIEDSQTGNSEAREYWPDFRQTVL